MLKRQPAAFAERQLGRQARVVDPQSGHRQCFGLRIKQANQTGINAEVVFELAQDDVQDAAQVLPLGNDLGDVVEQADAGQLLLQRLLGALAFANFGFQVLRARIDALLQLVVCLLQGGVALLNLAEHLIETINELSQLILGAFARAHGIIFVGRNGSSGCRQLEDGPGNDPLEQGRKEIRDQRRGKHKQHDNACVAFEPVMHFLQVRTQVNGPDRFALELDLMEKHQTIVFETKAVRLGKRRKKLGVLHPNGVLGELYAAFEQAGRHNPPLGAQSTEDFLGRGFVIVGQRGGALIADDFRQGREVAGHRMAKGNQLVGNEAGRD